MRPRAARIQLISMRSGTRRILGNLLLGLASLALTLAALEALARIALRSADKGKGDGTLALYTEHDPVLGWRKRPGARATYDRREYRVEVVVNSRGLRDRERDAKPAPGVFRVLALGDSFVEGYSVEEEHTVSRVLERQLTSPGCPAEVINGGSAAYSTDQELLFYGSEGTRYQPKAVVLFFYFNDVLFNARASYFGTPKPLLVERDGRLVLAHSPVPAPPSPRAPAAPAAEGSGEDEGGSALAEWVAGRLQKGQPRLYESLARRGLWPKIATTTPPRHLEVFRRHSAPDIKSAWSATGRILAELNREVRGNRAALLIAYVPSRMEVSDRDWDLTKIRYGMNERKWDRSRVAKRLEDTARSLEIPFLDLTPALRAAEHGILGGPYYEFDGHWNDAGHAVAAREVEAALRQRGLVPPCPRPAAAGSAAAAR